MSRTDKKYWNEICPLLFNIAVKYKATATYIVKETGAQKKAINHLARRSVILKAMDSFIRFKVLRKYLKTNITKAQENKTFFLPFSHSMLDGL